MSPVELFGIILKVGDAIGIIGLFFVGGSPITKIKNFGKGIIERRAQQQAYIKALRENKERKINARR